MARPTTIRLLTLFFLAVTLLVPIYTNGAQQPAQEDERPATTEFKREWHFLGLYAPKHPLTVFNARHLTQTLPDLELLSSQTERITDAANDLESKLRTFGQDEGLDERVFAREPLHPLQLHRVFVLSLSEKQAKELHELFSEARQEVREILLTHQIDKLVGAAIKQEGLLALGYEEVAALLEFEPEQRQQVQEIVYDGMLEVTSRSRPSLQDALLARDIAREFGVRTPLTMTAEEKEALYQEIFIEMHVKFAEVLTEDQVKTLKRIVAATKEDSDDSK